MNSKNNDTQTDFSQTKIYILCCYFDKTDYVNILDNLSQSQQYCLYFLGNELLRCFVYKTVQQFLSPNKY